MKKFTFLSANPIILALVLSVYGTALRAQLAGWQYKDAIKIQENSGSLKLDYQVLLSINTQTLIAANRMKAGGGDMRFSKDCNGAVLYPYWIESGINTATTQIWVLVDSLPANGSRIINMFYGNSTAMATASFDSTFTPASRLIVSTGSVVQTGVNNYSWFEVQSTASVTITPNAPFVVNARKIKISGTLNGNGGGYLGGQATQPGGGPGAGMPGAILTPDNTSGGGGAYGGNGGRGTKALVTNGDGGIAYGNNTTIDMGSGGGGPVGGGAGATDGNGGAGVTFNAREVIITGTILINGNAGTTINGAGYGGGGGAGGGFLLHSYNTVLSGTIKAKGGKGGGGAGGGGGGGGGRINLFSENPFTAGTYDVSYGLKGSTNNSANANAEDGLPGVISTGTFVANEPIITILGHVAISASASSVCQGSNVTLTAVAGFSNYNFFVNAVSVQNGSGNTYSSSSLANNSIVKVVATTSGGCKDTSNVITMTVNPNPTANAGSDAMICAGFSTQLSASGGSTYAWTPSTGLSNPAISNPVANPAATTTYTVMVGDGNGCSAKDAVVITVDPCTGITSNTNTAIISIMPNPSSGLVNVNVAGINESTITFELFSLDGRKVSAKSLNVANSTLNERLDLSGFAPGVYNLKIISEGTLGGNKKIVIQ